MFSSDFNSTDRGSIIKAMYTGAERGGGDGKEELKGEEVEGW